MFGLRPDLADMRILSQRSSPAGGHVEFQQIVEGMPVENGRVQVNLSRDGRVLQVVNSYAPLQPQGPANPKLSKEQATEAALTEFLRTTPEKLPDMRQRGSVPFTSLSRSDLSYHMGRHEVLSPLTCCFKVRWHASLSPSSRG